MSYTTIDAPISDWATTHSLPLFTYFGDREARFIYVSSDIGECFQISIGELQAGVVLVLASSVETESDEELSRAWKSNVVELRQTLESALEVVCQWMRRHEKSAKALKANSCGPTF